MQARTICITAIYKKTLLVRQNILHQASTVSVINLVSNDVFKFDSAIRYFSLFFVSPIVAILSVVIFVVYINPMGLLGMLYIVLHTPLQVGLGYLFGYFRYLQSTTGDKRIRMMDQIIRGMQVVKFYVWENPMVRYISKIRRKEIFLASLAGCTQSSTYSFFTTSVFIALFLIYSVSRALSQPLIPSKLALAYLLLNIVNSYCVRLLGNAIFANRECIIALRTIQSILRIRLTDLL